MHRVELLLLAGASADHSDQDGTALTQAVQSGNFASVVLLTSHGAQPDLANQQGATPLQCAVANGQSQMVDFLIEGIIADPCAIIDMILRGDTANVNSCFQKYQLPFLTQQLALFTTIHVGCEISFKGILKNSNLSSELVSCELKPETTHLCTDVCRHAVKSPPRVNIIDEAMTPLQYALAQPGWIYKQNVLTQELSRLHRNRRLLINNRRLRFVKTLIYSGAMISVWDVLFRSAVNNSLMFKEHLCVFLIQAFAIVPKQKQNTAPDDGIVSIELNKLYIILLKCLSASFTEMALMMFLAGHTPTKHNVASLKAACPDDATANMFQSVWTHPRTLQNMCAIVIRQTLSDACCYEDGSVNIIDLSRHCHAAPRVRSLICLHDKTDLEDEEFYMGISGYQGRLI